MTTVNKKSVQCPDHLFVGSVPPGRVLLTIGPRPVLKRQTATDGAGTAGSLRLGSVLFLSRLSAAQSVPAQTVKRLRENVYLVRQKCVCRQKPSYLFISLCFR